MFLRVWGPVGAKKSPATLKHFKVWKIENQRIPAKKQDPFVTRKYNVIHTLETRGWGGAGTALNAFANPKSEI